MAVWGFYGRSSETKLLFDILERRRWFFVSITGRRRIGKTRLIQEVRRVSDRPIFYVQIPDSDDSGVVSTVNDALEAFKIAADMFPQPRNLADFVRLIESMVIDGWIVVLDEFQYFNRKGFAEFCSLLQAAVDRLDANSSQISGGLIVLGSIQTEMTALLEDRSAPLYLRLTDRIELPHLDVGAVVSLIRDHAEFSPQRLLFLWTLFEGVPKFYRDCFEREVLNLDRSQLLLRIFFESSSPLRTEAENWFLRELRGRYDTMLKFVAKNPGKLHGDLLAAVREVGGNNEKQIGGYLQILTDRYKLIEKKQPIFASANARRGRYYISDNFLQAWLGALAREVAARDFRPVEELVSAADQRLADVEGFAFERLVGKLYEERSRKNLEGFSIQSRIMGFWDKGDIEIDFVAMNEDDKRIRFGSCKRSPRKLVADVNNFRGHVERFLDVFPQYRSWRIELVGFAPELDQSARSILHHHDMLAEDLVDLTRNLV